MKTVIALLVVLASFAIRTSAQEPRLASPTWVGPAHSGSWYTPDRPGEGFTLQVLPDGNALALWFTYPPAGVGGEQAWIYAVGRVERHRIRFDSAITTRGPRFGPAFDPARFEAIPWGTLDLTFDGCDSGEVSYAGPSAWGSGTRRLRRLTSVSELECTGKRQVGATGARALVGLRSRSGMWFDPTHTGEGWSVEELPDGRALVYWFTYDDRGEQAWTVGVSGVSGDRIVVEENLRPVGARFGAAFDPASVRLASWGRFEATFTSCDRSRLDYASPLSAFGTGSLAPVRLTRLAGHVCLDSTPSVPANGAWSAGRTMPQPQSEHAVASLGGMLYAAGGFGDPRGFKRYDPATDGWTVLPDLPGGRDHALAVSFDGAVYVTGGNLNGGGDVSSAGWRFDPALDRWSAVPELPFAVASGAAALDGYLYFADAGGVLHQFDPRTRSRRVFAGDGRTSRDHSQLVAFQGELWWIGGRALTIETPLVSIFDPASETWRDGPRLRSARAGFAAASSATLLIVAGGESLANPPRTLSSVEAIAAGMNDWSPLSSLPVAMHGFGAAILGNAFHALGGSTLAGGVRNFGDVQIFRWP